MAQGYYERGLDKIPVEIISIKDLKIEAIPPNNVMHSLAEIFFPTVEEYFKSKQENGE